MENPMDSGAWWPTIHDVWKGWTWFSNWACVHMHYHITKTLLTELEQIILKVNGSIKDPELPKQYWGKQKK